MNAQVVTGIDIRKALLAAGLRPSNYDEQGIYNYINGLRDTGVHSVTAETIVDIAKNYDLYNE